MKLLSLLYLDDDNCADRKLLVLFSQKLAFSDDESTQEEEVRRDCRSQSHSSKDEKRSAERDRDSESSDRDERRVSYFLSCGLACVKKQVSVV
jgi:hypothetical protein